jgi:hypothetical protein
MFKTATHESISLNPQRMNNTTKEINPIHSRTINKYKQSFYAD